ncbi:hypothetical protein ACFVUB_18115 [Streptomyces niveus]|uniref:hypothetical protein n=1 Tax=Streptomyces niveus TaxID=193462 RepID=UPI0036DF1FB7
MADRPARTYQVTNSTALFGPRCRIFFRSSAPAGSVVLINVNSSPVRALLTDSPLNGDLLDAQLVIAYL